MGGDWEGLASISLRDASGLGPHTPFQVSTPQIFSPWSQHSRLGVEWKIMSGSRYRAEE